jgi:hypothetical protein
MAHSHRGRFIINAVSALAFIAISASVAHAQSKALVPVKGRDCLDLASILSRAYAKGVHHRADVIDLEGVDGISVMPEEKIAWGLEIAQDITTPGVMDDFKDEENDSAVSVSFSQEGCLTLKAHYVSQKGKSQASTWVTRVFKSFTPTSVQIERIETMAQTGGEVTSSAVDGKEEFFVHSGQGDRLFERLNGELGPVQVRQSLCDQQGKARVSSANMIVVYTWGKSPAFQMPTEHLMRMMTEARNQLAQGLPKICSMQFADQSVEALHSSSSAPTDAERAE